MVVLGIDPGSSQTGFGVVASHHSVLRHVAHGVIRAGHKETLPHRLQSIYLGIQEVIEAHRPNGVAVEAIFHARNPRSSLILGHARGVVLLAAVHRGLAVYEYSPLQVKQALTGYGRADKHQIRAMVRSLLGIQENPPVDAADALGVAICHLNSHRLVQNLEWA